MVEQEKEFMITEYDRISTAYFGLQNQVNEWFKSYLTVIGFPITVLIAILRLVPSEKEITFTSLPNILAGLLLIIALLGLFITISIISMRMEMIMYARTINLVRRYFAVNNEKLLDYLALPKTDTKPGFYEKKDSLIWQISIMAIIDGALISIVVVNLTKINQVLSISIGFVFCLLHWLIYRYIAYRRTKKWTIKQPQDVGISNY